MQSNYSEYQSTEFSEALWDKVASTSSLPEADEPVVYSPTRFYGQFVDCMEMYASAQTVAEYLNAHQDWFCRCAKPMKADPLGDNGYALLIGRFGAFGYDVEPKIGLELLPPDNSVYRIKTIPIPDYVAPGYDVDFKAAMELVETDQITRIEWQLDLAVYVQFPKFIHRLPKSLIQSTGDRLLNQIVRQVSRRLTAKVQTDFYSSLGIPFPGKKPHKLGARQ